MSDVALAESERAKHFRAQFPVFERLIYLNAGTEGPVPRQAVAAVRDRVEAEAADGRCGHEYSEQLMALADRLREAYARVLGCSAPEVALTGSTTDGVNTVLAGLELRAGDEILTSDEEHPGLLAPLARAKRRYGVVVRTAPFAELASAVRPGTRLIACSHVSWVNGQVIDAGALSATGVPLLLDGAQGLGAVPVDVRALGCDFYAGSGQKWLCGPEGSGCLFVASSALEQLEIPWPGYGSLADPHRPLELLPADGAARLDHGFPQGIRSVFALASLEVLEKAGWEWVHDRGADLAELLADLLRRRGAEVAPRGRSTLVSWKEDDAEAVVERLAGEGIVIRNIPDLGLVRASLGAWSFEDDVERLLQSLRLTAGARRDRARRGDTGEPRDRARRGDR